jgi:Glu-tRNA(Gln) amidotransferase subunit E-like FAD-binding protein
MAIAAVAAAQPEAPAIPDVSKLISRGYDDAAVVQQRFEAAGFKDVRTHEFEFGVDIEADRFGEAMGLLVAGGLNRLWTQDEVDKYGTKDKMVAAITDYLKSNYTDGKWDGKMVANVTIAHKAAAA